MFFSWNGSQNPFFWYDILCALVLRSRLARVAPTTTLGIALSHFRVCMSITGGQEQCIRLSESLSILRSCTSKSQIWEISDFHPGEFTAPLLRWCTHTPGNSLGQPLVVLWRLCGPNERPERGHRRCWVEEGFCESFLKKNMHFSVISKVWFRDLRRSGWSENFLTSIFVFSGHQIA